MIHILEKIEHTILPETLLRYCNSECSADEREMIEKAASLSKELQDNIQYLKISLALNKDINEYQSTDSRSAYKKVHNRIKKTTPPLYTRITRYAAIFTIPLLISTLILGYLHFNEKPTDNSPVYAEVYTSPGTITRYELPDRTIVWLNSGSKLRYPTRFESNIREVALEGEAYFEVHADKRHPFYVNTNNGIKVYAYGTKFNVNTYNEEDFIEAVLEKGHVNIIVPEQKATVVLNPGERLLYNKDSQTFDKSETDVYEKTAWKNGKLVFRNTTLENVLKQLAKRYNVNITFDNISGKEYRYRATFSHESITQILDYLSKSVQLKWEMKDSAQQNDSSFTKQQIHVILYN